MKKEHSLKFIASTFNMSMTDVAKELKITPQTINDWLKGKRNIPKARVDQLAELFDLPSEYFQRDLLQSEKLEIQRFYIDKNATFEEYEGIVKEADGSEHIVTRTHSDDELISGMLTNQIRTAKLIERVIYMLKDEAAYNSKNEELLSQVVELMLDGSNQRFNMFSDIVRYLRVKKGGFDTTIDKGVVKLLDEIYTSYED